MEQKELGRLLHEIAGHFDAVVGEVERVAKQFASLGASEAEMQRLQRAKIVAERGAALVRTRMRDLGN